MSPKAWDQAELTLASALNTGPVRKSDLKNDLHKFFHRQRWRVEESEYKALLPSMRLASHLIEVSMPYLSSFLPSDQIHDRLTPITKNADRSASGYTITVDDDASQADLTEARAELDTVAGHVEWVVNYEMYRTLGWIGITRAVHDAPRPWGELAAKEILDKDEELKNRGLRRRLLTIGIMGEYVLALRQLPSNSEAHLRATFLAAITMTHEIGHAVFHQDYRSIDLAGDHGYEPWVGNDCWAELGLSYIGWIFGGYNPNPCETGTVDHAWSFHYPIAWFKQFTVDEQPLYETAYSIGIQYLEEVLSTEFWDSLGDPNTPNFFVNAKNKLKALTASSDQQPATAILPQWKYTKSQGLLWKFRFNDRRVGERPKVGKEVSEEEIEWEKDQFRVRYPHKNATLWNDKPNPRLNMRDDDDEDEDEDEEFGFGASSRNAVSNTGRNLNKLKEADLPPREIDDGFIQPDLSEDNDPGAAALTRVEVRYRPQIVVTPPDDDEKENFGYVAPRPDDGEDNDEQFGGKVGLPSNKPALRRNDPKDPDKDERFDKENYDANDIRAALYNKREYRVAKMSHKQAFKYCQLRNIRFGFTYEDDETWQKSYLDLDIDEERGLCQRIIQYSLRRLERSDRFKDDYAAIVQIKEWGSRIDNWEDKDLVEFCQFQGMSAGGDKRDRKARVQNWLKRDINVAKAELAKRDAATVTSQALVVVDRSDNPENWSQEDFIPFFSRYKLPTWGSLETWKERIRLFREEQVVYPTRWQINEDNYGIVLRTRNGVELYRWVLNHHRTTVIALKTELLRNGEFPSNGIFNLYFGADRSIPLEDDKPLSFYEGQDFKDIWLELSMVDAYDNSDDGDQPLIYQPPIPGKRKSPSNSSSKSPPKLDPSVKRSYDIMEGNAAPTITERMRQVGQTGSRLMQATEAGGGRELLQPHLKGRKSTSGGEMLDNLEDLDDEREEKEEALRQAVASAKGGNRDGSPDNDEIPRGSESSFMADTYRSAKSF